MSRLRFGVVGVGALGRHHARILSQLETAELVAVAETNPETGQAVAEGCNATWCPDYRQLFDIVDAVSIVVPTHAHLPIASEFLMRRIPVLVEKPLAANADEATQLVRQAETHGTLLQVGHIERFNPAMQVARPLCREPKYIRAERLSPFAFRSMDIGAIHDLMIHDIDLVLDLAAANVQRVDAFGVSILGGHEDTVQARIVFENGCIADLTANRVNLSPRRTLQVWSAEGAVLVDLHARTVDRYQITDTLRFGESPTDRAGRPNADIDQLKQELFGKYLNVEQPSVPESDALTAELESFVDCIEQNRRPLVGGSEALRAMQLAEQIRESVRTHQWDGHAAGPIGQDLQLPAAALKRAA